MGGKIHGLIPQKCPMDSLNLLWSSRCFPTIFPGFPINFPGCPMNFSEFPRIPWILQDFPKISHEFLRNSHVFPPWNQVLPRCPGWWLSVPPWRAGSHRLRPKWDADPSVTSRDGQDSGDPKKMGITLDYFRIIFWDHMKPRTALQFDVSFIW